MGVLGPHLRTLSAALAFAGVVLLLAGCATQTPTPSRTAVVIAATVPPKELTPDDIALAVHVASGLAGLAAVIASLEGHGDIVPFFVLLTFAGGVAAWAAESPFVGARRRLARGIAIAWLIAAVWVGVLADRLRCGVEFA